ncbi:MAG: NAD-dependent epimerase/dehydratase family protein [Chloroflexota bacterium]|nr:MAG: NAD-dependent epimerase/dehydratase family protein [Chloroflexota bacterium]
MRILITGSTGLIGSHLAPRLVREGYYVIGLTSNTTDRQVSEHRVCDVASPEAVEAASGADLLIHLGGLADASSSRANPVLYNRINALGTLHMLEAARRSKSAFVLASTQRIFRPQAQPIDEDTHPAPVDPYGYSKLVAEQWVRMYRSEYGVPTMILRFFSVYGPGQEVAPGATSGVVTIFLRAALAQRDLFINNHMCRDFTYAGDVADGIRAAICQPAAWGKTYHIATGVATHLRDLALTIKEITQSRSRIVVAGEDGEGENYVADISRARDELGYRAGMPLADGVRLYAQWLREHGAGAAEGAPDQTPA